jgi:hypothetical protein
MTTTYKVLGQVNPTASTLTTLYTVPANVQTICSTIVICNQGVSALCRIAIRPAGASIDVKQYIVYNLVVNQYDSSFLTLGITLNTTDVVSVYADTAYVSFSLFGSELS